jgi:hypothetical protein
MSTLNTSGQEQNFASQSTTKLVLVRRLAAAIAREYEVSDAADKTAINAIVDELVILAP